MNFLTKTDPIKLIVIVLILFSSCLNTSQQGETIEEIDLFSAYNDRSEVLISNIATDIEYIRLETGEDFMLNDPHLINVKDSLILFIGFRKIYVFSRNTGKFLYQISSFGRGPNEYSSTGSIYDEKRDLFFVNMGKKDGNYITVGYNFTGEIVKTISIPNLRNSDDNELPISRFWPLNDSLYLGYIDNPMVSLPEKIVVFDYNGKSLRYYPNYNSNGKNESGSFSFSAHKSMFFNAEDTIRFFELHTDTVFSINSHTIVPRYHINMGDLLLPYNLRSSLNSPEYLENFHIRTMHESSRFLIFSSGIYGIRHIVVYDKTLQNTMVCGASTDLDFYKSEDPWGIRCIGFSNDLDQFIPIGTDKNFYINRNDEFVTAIPGLEVKRWFDRNPEKAERLPEHLQAYRNIKDDDNPIIIIAKLKK
jgi:hypothetical protein